MENDEYGIMNDETSVKTRRKFGKGKTAQFSLFNLEGELVEEQVMIKFGNSEFPINSTHSSYYLVCRSGTIRL